MAFGQMSCNSRYRRCVVGTWSEKDSPVQDEGTMSIQIALPAKSVLPMFTDLTVGNNARAKAFRSFHVSIFF